MRLPILVAGLAALLSVAAFARGAQAPLPLPPSWVQPPATPDSHPARAIGRTHDCSGFYPKGAGRLNAQGDVLVRYDVGADGVIRHVVVRKSSGFAVLDAAALNCVRTGWHSEPAMVNGVAVASPGHDAIIRFVLSLSVGGSGKDAHRAHPPRKHPRKH